jgi:hypothetical protein
MRVRFTAKSREWWDAVMDYAEATNRTPSELVCEALDQIQARYPKKSAKASDTDLSALASRVVDIIVQRYPQVPFAPNGRAS